MSLASKETYINIESPLNSTYIDNYIEPEELATNSVIDNIEESNNIEELVEKGD